MGKRIALGIKRLLAIDSRSMETLASKLVGKPTYLLVFLFRSATQSMIANAKPDTTKVK